VNSYRISLQSIVTLCQETSCNLSELLPFDNWEFIDNWHCPFKNKCPGGLMKRNKLVNAPDLLIFHIQNLNFSNGSFASKKSATLNCPLTLMLPAASKYYYRLRSMIQHHGTPFDGGHYTCLKSLLIDDSVYWFDCSDAAVHSVGAPKHKQPYIIIYERMDS
jgi:uncharacterized UBP type Zn finger protein